MKNCENCNHKEKNKNYSPCDTCIRNAENTDNHEPPKQSAFQKWNKTELKNDEKFFRTFSDYRKVGWNAAIDEVISIHAASVYHREILALKEP